MEPARPDKQLLSNLSPVFLSLEYEEEPSLGQLTRLFLSDFFDWWYIKMPILLSKYAGRFIEVVIDQTSFFLLIRTFFVPWHRDTKAIGYLMGIAVRLIYLPLSALLLLISVLGAYSMVIGWLLIPIISIVMVILTPFL